ncbi:MAG: TIGR02281 family clan AA aspartic protease, partial [Methylotenera sp.]|nr:TIGR02281 family clan AA aspartic protease [Methylotenera sp.]
MKRIAFRMLKPLSIVLALSSASAVADTQINVVGLFSNKAVVMIDGGKPKTLSVGQTSAGVK